MSIIGYCLLFLLACFLVLLLFGLFFPRKVFLGKTASRYQVAFVYGTSLLITILAFVFVSSYQPQSERDFINKVKNIKSAYLLTKYDLCSSLIPPKVVNWVGTVRQSPSNKSDYEILLGHGVSIDIGSDIEIVTYEAANSNLQHIPKSEHPEKADLSPQAYNNVVNTENGRTVRFSSTFIPSGNNLCRREEEKPDKDDKDGIFPWSGQDKSPTEQFLFIFSDIQPVSYVLIPKTNN